MRNLKIIGGGLLLLLVLVVAVVAAAGFFLSAATSPETQAKLQKSSNFADGKFQNIEPAANIEFSLGRIVELFESYPRQEPVGVIPVVPIEPATLQAKPEEGLRLAWLGHASVMIEIDGTRVLTDPVLSERPSPFSFAGPKRTHKPPLSLEDLSGIDAVVISHNHYDHLDKATVRHLARQGTKFFVPLGNKPQLIAWNVPEAEVIELDWWEQASLGSLKIVATPARHYSSRGLFDFQETLWASWVVAGPRNRVFFSGDSGYSNAFAKVGNQYGPFDATIVKVGSYGPGQFWHDIHMPPEEAIRVHQDVKGKRMLPVHWLTFDLANHAWDEPIIQTVKAAAQANVKLITPRVGELVEPDTPLNDNWWKGID